MIGCCYGRTSKETDDAYSVSSQIDACLDYADRNNITIPDAYIFREDFSGKAFDRPEFTKIRELIKSRAIECVIIHSTDRLARKVSVGEIFLDEMIEHNVQLHNVSWGTYVKQTPEDKLRFNFETTFSSFERDKITERTTRGKTKIAESGKLIGSGRSLYGYDYNQYKDNYTPNEFAPIVAEILMSYGIDHVPAGKIAERLEARRIKTPGQLRAEDLEAIAQRKYNAGRIAQDAYEAFMRNAEFQRGKNHWLNQNVYNILKNARQYAGDYTYTLKGITYHVAIPPLISMEVAEEVIKTLEVGRRRNERNPHNTKYLMSRHLTCALCGYSISVAPKKNRRFDCYYACSKHRHRYNEPCGNTPVRNDVLDPIVKTFVKDLLLQPDLLFAWWEKQNEADTFTNSKTQEQIQQIDAHLEELQNKLYRTLDRLTDRLDEEEHAFYIQQRDNLKKRIAEYKEDKADLERSMVVTTVDQETIIEYAELGEAYRDVLETSTDFSFWRGLIDDLDITGEIGIDEKGQYIDLIIFSTPRKREYLGQPPDHRRKIIVDTESAAS